MTQSSAKRYNWDSLIEMAGILTNGDQKAMGEIAQLVRGVFAAEHREWCEEMDVMDGNDPHEQTRDIFAYWLTGYLALDDEDKNKDKNPSAEFGAYIDWKEMTEEVVAQLTAADKQLGYSLDFEKIAFSGEEFTDQALNVIGNYLLSKGFALLSLNTNSDCYHLFVIQDKDRDRLTRLAQDVDFRFVKFGGTS
ncbi:MAG: hypothetical protein LBD04_03570 [Synergistaceae bacterium]|jgi:hypothetical protein|nr:hypothetical protein [Synergistaceae bacterium]